MVGVGGCNHEEESPTPRARALSDPYCLRQKVVWGEMSTRGS